MSAILSLHDALYQDQWNIEQIEEMLLRDASLANEVEDDEVPLNRVLLDNRCSMAVVHLLLAYGADPNFKVCHGGASPLVHALYRRENAQIIKALIEAGAKADEPGDSPLNIALAMAADIKVIKLLISAGGDLFRRDTWGQSPLFNALGHFNVNAFTALLNMQAVDINTAKNQWNGSLLHSSLCIDGCTPVFVKFLIDSGISTNAVDDFGDTPLHVAVKYSSETIVDILLKKGSTISSKNCNGDTPLTLALERCNLDIIKLILKYCLLDNFHFDVEELIRGHELPGKFSEYVQDCRCELQRMFSEHVGHGQTLSKFMESFSENEMRRNGAKGFNLNLLLAIIADKLYPIYSDTISSKFERSLLADKLEECKVYTFVEENPNMKCVTKTIVLNNDCVRVLTNYVDENVLLKIIIAFCK